MTPTQTFFSFSAVAELRVTLIVVALIVVPFWICSQARRGGCELKVAVLLVLNVVGLVSGVFIFWRAIYGPVFQSAEDQMFAGLTGFILTLYALEQIYHSYRELFQKPDSVEPIREDKTPS